MDAAVKPTRMYLRRPANQITKVSIPLTFIVRGDESFFMIVKMQVVDLLGFCNRDVAAELTEFTRPDKSMTSILLKIMLNRYMKMTKENKTIAVTSTSLLSEGKSTRLMEMRRKAMGVTTPEQAQRVDIGAGLDKPDEALLLQAREIIDQSLTDILGKFPTNKKAKFFKIRYGMNVEKLKELPIKEIFSLLALKQKQPENMKRIADLDYNGRSTL